MAWSYSGDPADSALDEVRFLLGDTKETAQSLSDTEITFLLTKNMQDTTATAADSATIMANRYAELSVTSKSVGDLSLSYSYETTGARYLAMADRLKADKGLGVGFGMRDTSDSQFSIGITDNPTSERDRIYRRY